MQAGELVYPAGTAEEPYIYYVNRMPTRGRFFKPFRPTAREGSGKHVRVIVCKKDADGKMVLDTDEATRAADARLRMIQCPRIPSS